MTWLKSLRGRIFLASAMLAVLSIGVAVYLVSVRVTRETEEALHREIVANGALVTQLRAARTDTFEMTARLIADAPKLKAAVDTNDPPTVQEIVSDYQRELQSTLLLVTNKSGELLASSGSSPEAALGVAKQAAVRDALAGRERVGILAHPGGMVQLVTVPISIGLTHPDILGALSVGFLLDDLLAAQLKEVTGSEIAFSMDGHVVAATVAREHWTGLTDVLRGSRSPNVTLGAEEFLTLAVPLTAAGGAAKHVDGGPVALVLRSRTEHLRFLRTIHTELAVTAVIAVLLATLLSFMVARTITSPLAAITHTMREVAATGDLTRKIVLRGAGRWQDEDARLLATTFNTLTDSIARFQREFSQKERLTSLGRLSTVIAHEVRNPLMIIKAALHTLRGPLVTPTMLREAAQDIDEEVARLNRIVNEVLDFARPIQFERVPADVNQVCRESALAAEASPGPPVLLDLDSAVPMLLVDSERLRGALVNLVLNARHAVAQQASAPLSAAVAQLGHAGTVPAAASDEGRVFLSTRARAQGVTIVIADNGVGIEAADVPRIFDPYFTTKRGGTGLGLPIAKNVVEGLGGTISVASAPGRGTEIRVDLPAATGDPERATS